MVTQSPFFSLPGFRYEGLQGKAAKVQASALSEGTKRNYRSIWSLYDKFTRFYILELFLATPETLSSFITLVLTQVTSHTKHAFKIPFLTGFQELCPPRPMGSFACRFLHILSNC